VHVCTAASREVLQHTFNNPTNVFHYRVVIPTERSPHLHLAQPINFDALLLHNHGF
jgi:hypothetical protein